VAAATLGGIVCFEFLPNALSQGESMGFVFGGRVELKRQMTPRIRCPRFDVPQKTRYKCGRNMALGARGLNAESVGVMLTMFVFLKWRSHLVAARAEGFC